MNIIYSYDIIIDIHLLVCMSMKYIIYDDKFHRLDWINCQILKFIVYLRMVVGKRGLGGRDYLSLSK